MNNSKLISRRGIIKTGAVALATWPLANIGKPSAPLGIVGEKEKVDPWHGLKVGVATYTFIRKPLDYTIKAIQRVGLKYVSIKDVHLPLQSTPEERRNVVRQFKEAGITPLSCGNIAMKSNNEAEVRSVFEYAKDAGLPTIVCAPGRDLLPLLDKMVKEYNIKLAIHNHGPGDGFPSPYDAMKAI